MRYDGFEVVEVLNGPAVVDSVQEVDPELKITLAAEDASTDALVVEDSWVLEDENSVLEVVFDLLQPPLQLVIVAVSVSVVVVGPLYEDVTGDTSKELEVLPTDMLVVEVELDGIEDEDEVAFDFFVFTTEFDVLDSPYDVGRGTADEEVDVEIGVELNLFDFPYEGSSMVDEEELVVDEDAALTVEVPGGP